MGSFQSGPDRIVEIAFARPSKKDSVLSLWKSREQRLPPRIVKILPQRSLLPALHDPSPLATSRASAAAVATPIPGASVLGSGEKFTR
jgi:hypothetical protein